MCVQGIGPRGTALKTRNHSGKTARAGPHLLNAIALPVNSAIALSANGFLSEFSPPCAAAR